MLSPKRLVKTPAVLELTRRLRISAHDSMAVVVQGENGVGKRTLIEAALGEVDPDVSLVLRARADEYRSTFAPLSALFMDLLQQQERTAALKHILAGLVGDVLQLLPVPALVSQKLKDLYDAFVPQRGHVTADPADLIYRLERIFEALASKRRVYVVFTAIDQYDAASLSVITQLIRRRTNACFLLTFDPFATENEPAHRERLLSTLGSLAVERRVHRIRAARFDFDTTRDLIRAFFPDHHLTPEHERVIYERTGGNALFVRELLEHLRNEGIIDVTSAGAVITGNIESATIPAYVEELIERRLAGLDRPLREVLDIASVIGRRFTHQPIAGRLSMEELVVLNRLRDLQLQHDLVSEDEESHQFVFDSVRESVYRMLGPARAKSDHLFLARYFEEHPVPRDNEYLVYHHYLRATAFEQALEHLVSAAEEARRIGGHAESARRFLAARDLQSRLRPGDREERAAFAYEEGRASFDAGLFAEASTALSDAQGFTSDPAREGSILFLKGLAEYFNEEPDVAEATLQQFFASPRPGIEPNVVRAARLARSSILYALGRWQEARLEYHRGQPRAEDDATIFERAHARKRMNMFLWPEFCVAQIERSIADLEPFRDQPLYWELTHNLASNYLLLGDLDRAERLFERTLDAFRRARSHRVAYPLNNLAIVKLLRGDLRSAAEAAREVVRAPVSEFDRLCSEHQLAVIDVLTGNVTHALETLRRIAASLESSTEQVLIEITRHNLAWTLHRAGRDPEALAALQDVPDDLSGLWADLTRAKRERLARKILQITDPVSPDSSLARLEQVRRKDAWLFRDVDFEIADVWFWE